MHASKYDGSRLFHYAGTAALATIALWACACGPVGNPDPLPPVAAGAPKAIVVDLDRQVLFAWEGENLVHQFHAVTGSCAKWTLSGTYPITNKIEDYVSKAYGVPMPYTMFFSEDGKAIHGTKFATVRSFLHTYVSDTVGSKGCVGLSNSNARLMFDWAPVATPVVILPSERNLANREYPEE